MTDWRTPRCALAQLNAEQNQVTRLLHTFMYGGSEKDMPI